MLNIILYVYVCIVLIQLFEINLESARQLCEGAIKLGALQGPSGINFGYVAIKIYYLF